MKGYNTLEELSLQECYEILQKGKNYPHIEQIKLHYEQELKRWHADEKRDFEACKSLREYEQFIAKYQKSAAFYTMQYKKDALDKMETLCWKANNSSIKKCSLYLDKYPQGKYVHDARMKIRSNKRRNTITIIIVLIILALICTLFWGSTTIEASYAIPVSDESDVSTEEAIIALEVDEIEGDL